VRARAPLLAVVRERLAQRSAAEIAALFEEAGLPFAPIRRPEDLYDDPHLRATGGLADIVVPDGAAAGQRVKTTLSPIALDGARLPVRANPPRAGEHTDEILAAIGYSHDDVARLRARGVVD
jgi:crotonobetainyl-CoA:carnitine CoA-transferase CaiB-like acyl-CoA transferase